ncbi:CcdB family protein (plasmid) [Aliirhizobium terrae]|uniref:CcdB family protein n=1 Tax=Terrirhizobium terrae TaxID=2926709 RepID=UPI00257491B7|nr:CcdB family protein [Rhizobium sp. CC-CFT758]WJH38145.1 CcdB family protein [Rhizobium sp. CC-CFT758]
MARFHVHKLKGRDGLVLDLQADLLDSLETRVVAPVMPASDIGPIFVRLSPRVEIDGQFYLILIPSMASIPKRFLGETIVDLSPRQDEITAATDFLFQGF